ncbi:MAG: hypothetical protein P8H99_00565, partial [Luminiphilus sp.]|nr:hypothetical protein [Luminiphilus sp.]
RSLVRVYSNHEIISDMGRRDGNIMWAWEYRLDKNSILLRLSFERRIWSGWPKMSNESGEEPLNIASFRSDFVSTDI